MCKYVRLAFVVVVLLTQLFRARTSSPDGRENGDNSEERGYVSQWRKYCRSTGERIELYRQCGGFASPSTNGTDRRPFSNMIDVVCNLSSVDHLLADRTGSSDVRYHSKWIIYDLTDSEYYILTGDCYIPVSHFNVWVLPLEHIPPYLSNLCLMVTLALYLAIPKLRQKVYDKCISCHVATRICGFSSLIGSTGFITVNSKFCVFFGYMTQFWLLASFCWLNVMCIDMWRQIKSKLPSSERAFITYCLYAWGFPLLVSGIKFGTNYFLAKDSPFKSRFGEDDCSFYPCDNNGIDDDDYEFWFDPFFLTFFGVLSFINLYTFVATAFSLFYQNNRWKTNENQDCRRYGGQEMRFFQYLKLFLVMGLNWIMEMPPYYPNSNGGVWIAIHTLANDLQGVFISVIYVCNRRVISLVKERFSLMAKGATTAEPI